ncbi:DUF2145 domain-containing protein [Paucibacter sp. AS339]|uniref:DUF2145 domain-containing protein n=1 Tax=Paucibacter hankyongi TaxID=3133434 RepID=UPI0030B15875
MSVLVQAARAALALLLSGGGAAALAGGLRFCEQPPQLDAGQQDKLLRFASVVKNELDRSGHGVALVARAGTELGRFGMRYSHAGFALKASENTAWSVRQLYYACDQALPRLYDQGLSGFLLGANSKEVAFLSVLLLPQPQSAQIERAALDRRHALSVLARDYSANAYAFSTRYQNCNQWVLELMASVFGGLAGSVEGDGQATQDLRAQAQAWLQAQAYQPATFDLGFQPLLWAAAAAIPWVHNDDHPSTDLQAGRYRVSMPAAIEAFVQTAIPGAQRIEFCHTQQQVLVRRGWGPALAQSCQAEAGDQVIRLD